MAKKIEPTDPRLTWQGAVSIEQQDDWVMPWRIPFAERGLFHERLRAAAATGAGVRLAFVTDTRTLAVRFVPPKQAKKLDLLCDGRLHATAEIAPDVGEVSFTDLPPGQTRLELWLPPNMEFRLLGLEVDDHAAIAPVEVRRPRWIAYGSSITQASDAASPSRTWPAIVARGMDFDLLSLGFGGQCHLDGAIARLIRDAEADFISLCVGINVYGAASLNSRTFRPAILDFVRTIREGHPDVPLTLMSPIFGADRETNVNAVGFTLPMMRGEVCLAAETLRSHGDGNVHYVHGLDILGPEDWRLLPDNLHPNGDGYVLMGRNFIEKVARPIFQPGLRAD